MKKLFIGLLVTIGLFFGVGFVLILFSGALEESEYSHCVIANDVSSFTGEYLKNDGNVTAERMLIKDCMARDQELDNGNGKKAGVVRWVVCLKGPDCDEGGNF